MPEGHHIHWLAGQIEDRFAGQVVSSTSPQGRFAASAAMVDGTELVRSWAVGKHLFVGFAHDRIVHVHLGLIGKLGFTPWPGGTGQIRWRVGTPAAGVAELRGPQTCALITPAEADAIAGRSGPDPLDPDADPERAWRKVHASAKPIAALLMDQAVFAGVGNIYRAEVLFRAGLDPDLPGKALDRAQFDALWGDLVALMPLGVRDDRIDTVRAEHLPEAMGRPPREDAHGGEVYVYRRAGLPCHVCGTPVRTRVLAGRNLYWCEVCQRPTRRGR